MTGWQFSDTVLAKARRYLRQGRVSRDLRPGVYYVQGTTRRPYTVTTDADLELRTARWIACSCKFGTEQGAGTTTCSHAAAVLTVILDGLDVPVREEP